MGGFSYLHWPRLLLLKGSGPSHHHLRLPRLAFELEIVLVEFHGFLLLPLAQLFLSWLRWSLLIRRPVGYGLPGYHLKRPPSHDQSTVPPADFRIEFRPADERQYRWRPLWCVQGLPVRREYRSSRPRPPLQVVALQKTLKLVKKAQMIPQSPIPILDRTPGQNIPAHQFGKTYPHLSNLESLADFLLPSPVGNARPVRCGRSF